MPRGNGGVLGPANIPTTSVAKGVWSLMEQQLAQRQGIWPIVVSGDPYFEYTTLLLPGNGTNGAQNNTFLDGSTNNFTITRNGNTTQGTFSPFSQTGWGNYFNGSSYLSIAANAAFNYGSGNFTIEAWVNLSSTSSNFQIYASTTGGYSSPEFIWVYNSTVGLRFYAHAGTYDIYQGSISGWSARTWYHVALVRNGTTVTLYKDGVSVASGSVSTASFGSSTSTQAIAASVLEATYATGYISNLRVVKGVAVYTGNFTVPTSALTATQSAGTNISAITGTQTSLLTCQSNRFIDNSTNNFTITRNGNTSVVAFSPFNPTASWSAATYGGSGYFDGTGDYLTAPSNAAFTLDSTGDFTVECWIYPTASLATSPVVIILSNVADYNSAFTNRWALAASGSTLGWLNSNGGFGIQTSTLTLLNTWTHVAVVRSGSTITMYVNGVASGTQTTAQSYTTQSALGVGYVSGATAFPGYISNARVVKGTAVYTSNFTPPTAPLTAITNTSLLLNFTNAGIYDATSKNDLETVGNAQISTTQSKWGGSSMYFDGSGDYLKSNPATTDMYAFGSGDFTIEFWMYISSLGLNVIYEQRLAGGPTTVPLLYIQSSTLKYLTNGADRIVSSTLSTGQWYHVALARSGTSTKLFLNGTQTGSTYTDTTVYTNTATKPWIGVGEDGANAYNGYIQDLRITKGYARYTANFTPPTAAFPTL